MDFNPSFAIKTQSYHFDGGEIALSRSFGTHAKSPIFVELRMRFLFSIEMTKTNHGFLAVPQEQNIL
ncbi:hypothetical protein [Flavobacterium pectinovorum]|uniref:Uncharacterized protein n=1 Tax=Flavobacterium pectinovorum TaxID=29533 RepID=A0A502EQE9_9FLAO|nr:hypothetical protein [Flavobacterium pectinovorum]TPG39324.1 hypothetical protein EAH81_13845 [Flavobacterium pectinovorum]